MAFAKSTISILSPQGQMRATTKAVVAGDLAVIDDASVVVEGGDAIQRQLPNGQTESFLVTAVTYYDAGVGGIGPHFQVKLRRQGNLPTQSHSGHHVTVSGPNSRVNIGSQDYSQNVSNSGNTFDDLRAALATAGLSAETQTRLKKLVDGMEETEGKSGFIEAYQKFVAGVGDHVKIVAPFLPYLTKYLGG